MKSLAATFVLISLCVTVAAQPGIQVTVSASAASCEDYHSEILIIATRGTPPYSYALDGGDWSNSQVFVTRGGGPTHTVQVKDAAGHTASKSVTIYNYYSAPTLRVAGSCCGHECHLWQQRWQRYRHRRQRDSSIYLFDRWDAFW